MRFSFMTTGLRSHSITKTARKQSISPSLKNRAWVRILMHSLHQKETTIFERRSSFFGFLPFSLFRSSLFAQIGVSGEWIRENRKEKRQPCCAKQIYKKPVENSRQVFNEERNRFAGNNAGEDHTLFLHAKAALGSFSVKSVQPKETASKKSFSFVSQPVHGSMCRACSASQLFFASSPFPQ